MAKEKTDVLQQQTEKNLRTGMSPGEARRHALLRFGGVEHVREQTRDEFRAAAVENLGRHLRFSWRALVAALASYVSAQRGTGPNPLEALRNE